MFVRSFIVAAVLAVSTTTTTSVEGLNLKKMNPASQLDPHQQEKLGQILNQLFVVKEVYDKMKREGFKSPSMKHEGDKVEGDKPSSSSRSGTISPVSTLEQLQNPHVEQLQNAQMFEIFDAQKTHYTEVAMKVQQELETLNNLKLTSFGIFHEDYLNKSISAKESLLKDYKRFAEEAERNIQWMSGGEMAQHK